MHARTRPKACQHGASAAPARMRAAHLVAQLLALFGDLLARILNLLFTRQEQQHIPRGLTRVDLHHRADGGLQVVALRLLRHTS